MHLKIDTGLGRGGAAFADWADLVTQVAKARAVGSVEVIGMWSHLAFADEPDEARRKAIVEKIQLRAAETPTHAFLGQYVAPMAVRKNVTGSLISSFALNERQVATCVAQVRRLAACIAQEDFDFEAASNFLAVLARLRSTEIQLSDADTWITSVAQRFCVSKASADMLCKSVQEHEPHVALIRSGHTEINLLAEQAMAHSVKGRHADAVTSLMQRGTETLNAKLVELAGKVLTRHGAKIEASASTIDKVEELRRRFCSKGTQVALGGAANRAAGGVMIRS